LPESLHISIEERAEVLHAGEERSQFVPLVAANLLRENRSSRCEDSMDFAGIHLLVPIEDEVERAIPEWEVEAVSANHLDPQMRQRTFGNRRIHGPRLGRDGTSAVSLAKFREEFPAASPEVERIPGACKELLRPPFVIPRQARSDLFRRNAVKIPSHERPGTFDVRPQAIDGF